MVLSSLKAAFYVQGSSSNLSSSASASSPTSGSTTATPTSGPTSAPAHATFDKVFVCRPAGCGALCRARRPHPRVADGGRRSSADREDQAARARRCPPVRRGRCCTRPTWQGGKPTTNYSSLPLGAKIVAALLERGATVIFRPHPFSYRDPGRPVWRGRSSIAPRGRRERTGRQHVWGTAGREGPGTSPTASTTPTRWSPTSPRWPRTSWPPASRWPWWPSSSAARRSPQEIPMARVAYVIEKDLSTLDGRWTPCSGRTRWRSKRRAYRITAWVSGSASMLRTASSRPRGASSKGASPPGDSSIFGAEPVAGVSQTGPPTSPGRRANP